MSSTTEITINFTNNSTYSLTVGSGVVAHRFGIKENDDKLWEGQHAMDFMYGIQFQNSLPLWHRNMINLMLMEEVRVQEDRDAYSHNPENPEPKYPAVFLNIRHIR